MFLPLAALAFLAYLMLRPTLKGRLPAWRRTTAWRAVTARRKGTTDRALAVGMVAAALAVLVHGNLWVACCLFGLSLWTLGRASGGDAPPAQLMVTRSANVELAVDRATGRRSARIISGAQSGLVLDSIDLSGCLSVLQACRLADPPGAGLLETYLDGRSAGWRAAADAHRDAGPRRARATGGMTEEQAYELLGLGRGAARDAIVRAHRTLMKKWHPDQGGTAELAARANEAKEVLLRRHG